MSRCQSTNDPKYRTLRSAEDTNMHTNSSVLKENKFVGKTIPNPGFRVSTKKISQTTVMTTSLIPEDGTSVIKLKELMDDVKSYFCEYGGTYMAYS